MVLQTQQGGEFLLVEFLYAFAGGVVFRLPDAFRQYLIPRFRFDRRQLRVAILQNVVDRQRLSPPPVAFDATESDWIPTQRFRLPSTTPQPAAASAGSMCSALVSASFMERVPKHWNRALPDP